MFSKLLKLMIPSGVVFLMGVQALAFQNPFACELAFDPFVSYRDFRANSWDYGVGKDGQYHWGDRTVVDFPASYGLRFAAQVDEGGNYLEDSHIGKTGDDRMVLFKNGMGVDGKLVKVIMSKKAGIAYLSFAGPTNFMYADMKANTWKLMPGQTAIEHHEGFGTAMGPIIGFPQNLAAMEVEILDLMWGISPGKKISLKYESGVLVTGIVKEVQENPAKPGYAGVIQFVKGTAKVTLGGQVLFDPSWGTYDLMLADGLYNAQSGNMESHRVFLAKVEKLREAVANADQAAVEQLLGEIVPTDDQDRALISEALKAPRI